MRKYGELRSVIVLLANQKGGVGKTTTAIAIASELTARGEKTLLVDADPQRSAMTWADVAIERKHPAPVTVAMGAGLHDPGQLPRLAADYAHVVIDTPPRVDTVMRSALMVCHVVVVPSGQSGLDAWALAETIELITKAKALRPGLHAVALLTRVQGRTVLGRSARDMLTESGLAVLRSELAYRVSYQEAINTGQGPTTYAPGDEAAQEVRHLVTELLELTAPTKAKPAARKGGKKSGR